MDILLTPNPILVNVMSQEYLGDFFKIFLMPLMLINCTHICNTNTCAHKIYIAFPKNYTSIEFLKFLSNLNAYIIICQFSVWLCVYLQLCVCVCKLVCPWRASGRFSPSD